MNPTIKRSVRNFILATMPDVVPTKLTDYRPPQPTSELTIPADEHNAADSKLSKLLADVDG